MLGDELLDVIHRYPDHVWVFLHEFPALTDRTRPSSSACAGGSTNDGSRRSCRTASTPASSATSIRGSPRSAWLGMHNYTYLWLKAGGRLSARDVAKPFADIFIRGIADSP